VILEALERLMVGRTTFVIAHRLSTVRNVDLILVLDHGELVEQGTPADLLRLGGLYRELHDVQSGQRRARGAADGANGVTQPTPDFARARGNGELPHSEPSAYRVDWLSHAIPSRIERGTEHRIKVALKNTSDMCWSASHPGSECVGPVMLSYHWLSPTDGAPVIFDGIRSMLPSDLGPEESASVDDAIIVAPEAPGDYRLQLTLVHEGVAWFEREGAETITVPIAVIGPDDQAADTSRQDKALEWANHATEDRRVA
jgi:hypothetical protein